MTTALNTAPTGRTNQGQPDCPPWCTRTHGEAPDEIIMHESTAAHVSARPEPGVSPTEDIRIQLNRLMDGDQDRCYVVGSADLTIDGVREMRDRLTEILILMGVEIDEFYNPVDALIRAALTTNDSTVDPLAYQALLTLADRTLEPSH